ncbi:flotillin [Streptococcus henryi]|uniref:Flotillin n=1 Tax=Streptococcus henryi TaxID=439219 RepID=A0A1G5ZZI1_9STRE|nr:flotillin family protein [Streptococcus henryi]SDB01601.1 flotillin [Streptococcus henryi]
MINFGIIIGIVLVILALGIFFAGFVSASPGEIKVISGPRGQRVLHGKTGWKIPILERVDSMTAGMISVDARTADYVPTNDYINVKVDAAVKVKIGTERPELFQAATRNFLYKSSEEIADEVRDTLEGHLRAIIGQMKLAQIVTDRVSFSEKVQDNATKDLEEMGLEIVAFNIQGLIDDKGVIENLGIDNTEQIRKEAAKAKAKAQQEIAQQQAESDKLANDARVAADLEIAQKQTELAKRQAALKAEADTETAKADAAYSIQQQIQRKDIERETAEANIVKQEQEALVKEQEVKVRRQALEAEIKAQADAERYAQEQQAQANLFKRQKEVEAEAYERTQQAQADKEAMLAEAEGIRAKGEAEAAAIAAKLRAEAEGLEKKAEAMAKMNQAAVLEMYFNALPDVARAVAEPLTKIDSITMYGEGNSAKMVEDITKSMTQVQAGLNDSVGIDVKQLLNTLVGVKASSPVIENAVENGVKDALKQENRVE